MKLSIALHARPFSSCCTTYDSWRWVGCQPATAVLTYLVDGAGKTASLRVCSSGHGFLCVCVCVCGLKQMWN